MAGEAVGSMLFGLLAIFAAFALVRRLEREHKPVVADPVPVVGSLQLNPESPV